MKEIGPLARINVRYRIEIKQNKRVIKYIYFKKIYIDLYVHRNEAWWPNGKRYLATRPIVLGFKLTGLNYSS